MSRIQEPGAAHDHFYAIARQLGLGNIHLGLDDLLDPKAEVGHQDLFLDVIIAAVDALVLEAGEVHHGLAHRLARDGSGVDTGAADDFALLDDGDAPAAFCALNRRALAGGTGTDDDDVEFLHERGRGISPAQLL